MVNDSTPGVGGARDEMRIDPQYGIPEAGAGTRFGADDCDWVIVEIITPHQVRCRPSGRPSSEMRPLDADGTCIWCADSVARFIKAQNWRMATLGARLDAIAAAARECGGDTVEVYNRMTHHNA